MCYIKYTCIFQIYQYCASHVVVIKERVFVEENHGIAVSLFWESMKMETLALVKVVKLIMAAEVSRDILPVTTD